jgi:hypothetical protein
MVAALSSCGNNCSVLHLNCTYHIHLFTPSTRKWWLFSCSYWNPVCDVYVKPF